MFTRLDIGSAFSAAVTELFKTTTESLHVLKQGQTPMHFKRVVFNVSEATKDEFVKQMFNNNIRLHKVGLKLDIRYSQI